MCMTSQYNDEDVTNSPFRLFNHSSNMFISFVMRIDSELWLFCSRDELPLGLMLPLNKLPKYIKEYYIG